MTFFITNRTHSVQNVADRLVVLNEVDGRASFTTCRNLYEPTRLALDTETTGVEPLADKILLISIGFKEGIKFVIDATSVDFSDEIRDLNEEIEWIGQNLKFEYGIFKTNYQIKLRSLYDLMIVEDRLYANYFDPKTKPNTLDKIIQRYVGYVPSTMLIDTGREFVGMNPANCIFSNRHVEYSGGDVGAEVFVVHDKQRELIGKYKMELLFDEIEFPLISILGEAELEGLSLDKDGLRKIIAENKKIQFTTAVELDNHFRKLRDEFWLAIEEDVPYISGGCYDAIRVPRQEVTALSLFEEESVDSIVKPNAKKPPKPKASGAYINWGSSDEIIFILGRLGFEVPTKEGKYIHPVYNEKNKLLNHYEEFTTGEKAFEQFIIDRPNSPIIPFIKTLLKYREATTELTKYGEDFLRKINPTTGKIHTIFRQAKALNGRLQSGGGKEGMSNRINIQNIPRKPAYRHLFGSDGYDIVTYDLAGAEVTIMADKANDLKLFELAMKGDIHSYLIQRGWRAIYAYRASKAIEKAKAGGLQESEYHDLKVIYENSRNLAETLIVSKKINNDEYRVPGKNLTFGAIYGCKEKKAAKTINCSQEEGIVYLAVQRNEIPLTYEMVDRNVELAFRQGFLINNTRTNSRVWFPAIVNARREGRTISFKEQVDIDGQARNVPISGTQADLIKEAMVNVDKYIKQEKIDCALLMSVHDEIVYRAPSSISAEFSLKVKEILCDTANLYLSNIKMDAEGKVAKCWDK